jgi:hypothetical protein
MKTVDLLPRVTMSVQIGGKRKLAVRFTLVSATSAPVTVSVG